MSEDARDPRLEGDNRPADMGGGRGDAEAETHSFIIKIWLEERTEETGRARWRGHITHVPSGVRTYVRTLDDVAAVIHPYLEKMGVRRGVYARLRRWFKVGRPAERRTQR